MINPFFHGSMSLGSNPYRVWFTPTRTVSTRFLFPLPTYSITLAPSGGIYVISSQSYYPPSRERGGFHFITHANLFAIRRVLWPFSPILSYNFFDCSRLSLSIPSGSSLDCVRVLFYGDFLFRFWPFFRQIGPNSRRSPSRSVFIL